MEQTKIEINASEDLLDPPLDEEITKSAIFVEDANYGLRVSQITLSGKYNRKYTIAAFCVNPAFNRVLVENELLIVCLWSDILVIDLESDKLLRVVSIPHSAELFEIHRFKSGYFIYGELDNYFLDKDFNVVWEEGCVDIFFNPNVENVLEIFEDYITVFDWYGYKHFYDESGEFKTEHFREYSMD